MTQKSSAMSVASLVLGIFSIVIAIIPFLQLIALICGVLAIIFAIVAKNKIKADSDLAHTNGTATGGLTTGIIGASISIIAVMILFSFITATNEKINEFEKLDEIIKNLKPEFNEELEDALDELDEQFDNFS